ncbi:MAG: MarR family transcriptional regulator [Sphingomonas sp.]|nr:MarR family transcriptional regulator [Sphingomonas sp.]
MVEDEIRDIAGRLHSASIRLLRTLRREDDGSGLTAPRLSALSVIVFAGPLSLAALAEAEQVRPPTMSRIVDALVKAGLVTRDPDPDDRRGVRIAATEPGRRLLDQGRARRVGALVERLRDLTDYERRALARGAELLERITR